MQHVKYSLQQQLIIFYFSLLWNYGIAVTFCSFYAFVDIAIRLFATDLSLLIRFSMIEVKQKEVDPRSYEYYLNSSKNKT